MLLSIYLHMLDYMLCVLYCKCCHKYIVCVLETMIWSKLFSFNLFYVLSDSLSNICSIASNKNFKFFVSFQFICVCCLFATLLVFLLFA